MNNCTSTCRFSNILFDNKRWKFSYLKSACKKVLTLLDLINKSIRFKTIHAMMCRTSLSFFSETEKLKGNWQDLFWKHVNTNKSCQNVLHDYYGGFSVCAVGTGLVAKLYNLWRRVWWEGGQCGAASGCLVPLSLASSSPPTASSVPPQPLLAGNPSPSCSTRPSPSVSRCVLLSP